MVLPIIFGAAAVINIGTSLYGAYCSHRSAKEQRDAQHKSQQRYRESCRLADEKAPDVARVQDKEFQVQWREREMQNDHRLTVEKGLTAIVGGLHVIRNGIVALGNEMHSRWNESEQRRAVQHRESMEQIHNMSIVQAHHFSFVEEALVGCMNGLRGVQAQVGHVVQHAIEMNNKLSCIELLLLIIALPSIKWLCWETIEVFSWVGEVILASKWRLVLFIVSLIWSFKKLIPKKPEEKEEKVPVGGKDVVLDSTCHHIIPNNQVEACTVAGIKQDQEGANATPITPVIIEKLINRDGVKQLIKRRLMDPVTGKLMDGEDVGKLLHAVVSWESHNLVRGPSEATRANDPKSDIDREILSQQPKQYQGMRMDTAGSRAGLEQALRRLERGPVSARWPRCR